MFINIKLISVSLLVAAVSASSVVWITDTVYTCPCPSSTLSTKSSSVEPVGTSSILSIKSSSLEPVGTSSTATGPKTTPSAASSTSTKTSTATISTTSAAGSCIPFNADCSQQTEDFYCCNGYVCDIGLDNPICIVDDSGSTTSPAVTTTPTTTTPPVSTTSTTTAAGSCTTGYACGDAAVDPGDYVTCDHWNALQPGCPTMSCSDYDDCEDPNANPDAFTGTKKMRLARS